jgi:hypothetical protein
MISLMFSLVLLQAEAPMVHIHAPARIDLDSPRRQGNLIAVSGRLVDDETFEPVSGRIVVVTSLEQQLGFATRRGELTDENGHFGLQLSLPPGQHRIVATFDGDATLSRARAERTADLGLRALDIRVEGPARVHRSDRVRFRIHATSDDQPADILVQLDSGATVRMDGGAAEVEIVARGRGPQRFEASYAGDDVFHSARGFAQYRVEVPVTVTLESAAAGTTITRGDDLALSGQLRDADGPLALSSVEIRVLGQPLAVAQADAAGAFATELSTRKLAAGHLQMEAVFRPSAPWHAETHSLPLAVTLVVPEPPPLALFALPALLVAALVLGRRLLRIRAGRTPRTAPIVTVPPSSTYARGLRKTSAPHTLRASDLVVEGRIVDARTDRPVGGAQIDGQKATVESSEAGHFSLTLSAGSHEIVVRADGYCNETFSITVPHRGQLRGVEVRIAPIRLRVLECFRIAAAPSLGDRMFDLVTPREIAPLGGQALSELAALVEETNYSGRPPASQQVEHARRLAEEELTGGRPIHTMRRQ